MRREAAVEADASGPTTGCRRCVRGQPRQRTDMPDMAFKNGTFARVPNVGGGLLAYYLQRRANASEQLVAPPAGFVRQRYR